MHFLIYICTYLICIFAFVTLYKIVSSQNNIMKKWANIVVMVVVIFFSAIRCNFGSDYYSYYRTFNYASDIDDILSLSNGKYFQIGYAWLIKVVRVLSHNYEYAFFIAVSVIVYPIIFLWIYKHSKNIGYSLLYFFLLDLFDISNNTLKQIIAITFLLIAYDCLVKRKILFFAFWCIIALGFHSSSIIIIAIMIGSIVINVKERDIPVLLGVSILISVFYPWVSSYVVSKIQLLQNYGQYAINRRLSMPFLITSVLYIILFVYSLTILYKREKLTLEDKQRINIVFLSIPFAILSINYIVVIRICYFALFQLVILMPMKKIGVTMKRDKYFIDKYTLFLIVFFICVALLGGANRYYNYSTIWNDIPKIKWYR